MARNSIKLLVLAGCLWYQAASDYVADEEGLRNALFTSYTREVRPQQSMGVLIFLIPLSLNKLDIGEQYMSINTIMAATWYDPRMTWDPTVHGGIEEIAVATDTAWTPTIVVENAVDNAGVIGNEDKDKFPVRVTYQGIVSWYPLLETITSCEMRISQYPFDSQECFVTLTGWAYPEMEVNLTAEDTSLVYYTPNGEWELQREWTETGYFTDGKQFFRRLKFYFNFRRKWQFYGQNLVMPIVLTSILMCAVFALPIESGEKLGFSLTVLLSYIVFLTWVTDNLPAVSTDVSVLQVYLAIVLGLGVLATLLTTWVLHLYHRDPAAPMCTALQFFANRVFLPVNNFTCCARKRARKDDVVELHLPHENKNRVVPLNDKGNSREKNPRKSISGESRDEPEEITWAELAVMADRFFLIVFGLLMSIVTVTIIGILYSGYYLPQ